jgi:hypothetical protein
MAIVTRDRLKRLFAASRPGTPLTTAALASYGISPILAAGYVRSGWLEHLGRGVYSRPGQPLNRDASLLTLQSKFTGLHVGGKTALDWYGIRQYVTNREVLELYGWDTARLPQWFTSRFPSEYHRKRLFRESPDDMLYVTNFENRPDGPAVSEPERALLELLSEVGVRQPLQEAREIMESAYSMRADVLTSLLLKCTSVKTVRLCLQLAREFDLSWLSKIDIENLPTGSDRPWVARSRDGLLVLKP